MEMFQILECRRFIAPSSKPGQSRVVKDYELDFYVQGTRTMWTDGQPITVQTGDVCFRTPGQEVYSVGDYNCYQLTLDFSMETSPRNYSRNVPGNSQRICKDPLLQGIPSVMTPIHGKEIGDSFAALVYDAVSNAAAARQLVLEIFYPLHADYCHQLYRKNQPEQTAVNQIMRYLQDHLSEPITLADLSRLVHLDRSYLSRLFRKRFGMAPMQYLSELRLDRARELLLNTNRSIHEISEECGYHQGSFFSAQYKRKYQLTPKQQRKMSRFGN